MVEKENQRNRNFFPHSVQMREWRHESFESSEAIPSIESHVVRVYIKYVCVIVHGVGFCLAALYIISHWFSSFLTHSFAQYHTLYFCV